MKQEDFMSQSADDMTVEELAEAIKIKEKQARQVAPNPNVFKSKIFCLNVDYDGSGIRVHNKSTGSYVIFTESLPLLEKAIERAKELREDN